MSPQARATDLVVATFSPQVVEPRVSGHPWFIVMLYIKMRKVVARRVEDN
jgi:hypothetical protein